MSEEIIRVTGWGMLPCLHCGEIINLNEEIHLCDAPKNKWLNKQEKAVLILPDGEVFDLKSIKEKN
jgi:hypothetical protein